MFGWFDGQAARAFGEALARSFVNRVPLHDTVGDKKFEARAKAAITLLSKQVAEFKRENKLNIYKKARLANRFKWALKEAGYPDSFIDELAFELATLSAIPD